MKAESKTPSKELLVYVRVELILQGSSFNAWCKANGVVRRTAEQSLSGDIRSENAKRLVETILKAIERRAA